MIVNPWTVSALSLDAVSAGLGLITVGLSFKQVAATWSSRQESGEQLAKTEDRLYLLFWLGAVFLLLRFLAWPFFYLTLHSIIPEVAGAMCIFGTRNLLPELTRGLELTKPLLFYTGLVWLLLFRLERFGSRTETGIIARKSSLLLLCFCSIVGLVDSSGSIALWLQSSAELAVSCCTTITDIPSRFTVWVPESLFGPGYERLLWIMYFLSNAVLVFAALLTKKTLAANSTIVWSLSALTFLVLVNCLVGIFALIEVIAPRLMGLPFHHCLYCLVQNVADAPIFVSLFAIGNNMIGAVLPLWLLARGWAVRSALVNTASMLLTYGALSLGGGVFIVLIHLVL